MRINHNIQALNTHRQLTFNNTMAGKSLEKLSSGFRINRAGDDAAGLAISEKMRAQIRGLDMAAKNAQDGISLIQTAEGALSEVHAILQRMRELADQSANGTNTSDDRAALQEEIQQLKDEIDRIGNTTEFNTMKLLNGNLKSAGSANVDLNTTTGAIVAKLTGGYLTGSGAMAAAGSLNFVAETIRIDGVEITVDWQNLTSSERDILNGVTSTSTTQQAAKDLIVKKINEAIDASGLNVAHISAYVDSSGQLVLQSGSKGTNSKIEFVGNTNSVLYGGLMGAGGGELTPGTSTYNGSNIAQNSLFKMNINGIDLEVSLSGAVTTSANMADVAANLQSSINKAIAAYNAVAPEDKQLEDVTVNVSNDGRFVITNENGPITFADYEGSTVVSDLGLSLAQTEAASNGGVTFQIGANRGQTLSFGIGDMRSAALGIVGVDISTATGASQALDTIDNAIKVVSQQRSKMGAVQNRLEHTINNLQTASENLTAAESRIRDVDMAKEMMEFTKSNILTQAAQAMLAQANQQPQGVLQLLR